jgi:uncharacterized protein (DUF1800 family)
VSVSAISMNPVSRWRGVVARRAARAVIVAGVSAALLAACGGSGGGSGEGAAAVQPTTADASRFLAQATMGPREDAITVLAGQTYGQWMASQFAEPATPHKAYLDRLAAEFAAAGTGQLSASHFYESWWQQAVTGPDQLRQRVAFALSQIFVVSFADSNVSQYPRGMASYYDTLAAHAFGNYRDLLQAVTLHPMMGVYLTSLRNQKEDPATGRVPDENYAREVMQLFSVGLYELNPDGTRKLDSAGNPIETYTMADIQGLARVFTGWSWYAGPNLTDRTRTRFFGGSANAEREWQPMQDYNRYTANTDFHSAGAKTFLGKTIAAQSTPDAQASLKEALDHLFNHPNVGPFIGGLLIQRLVKSNPSPGYVARVAAVFNNNGAGVRGDLKAVVSAILLDPEARTLPAAGDAGAGKIREPVLRLAHWMRAFNARSTSGRFLGIDNTDDPATRLGQTPLRAPTVFNFFRPGYTPPNTALAAQSLVAPELQVAHEVSVAGYLNYLQGWVRFDPASTRDVRQDYTKELDLVDKPSAAQPTELIERVNLLLMGGLMSDSLKTALTTAIAGRAIPAPTRNSAGAITNQAAIDSARRDRVAIAIFLTMAAPEYLAQR